MFENFSREDIIKYGYGFIMEDIKRREELKMEERQSQKTPEQLRAELIAQIKSSGMEYVNEVAMPGIIRPVKSDD